MDEDDSDPRDEFNSFTNQTLAQLDLWTNRDAYEPGVRVLDACFKDDPNSRVACETFTTTGLILIGGEITTNTYVDVQEIARGVAKRIGLVA